jgi:hypothetical protein
MDGSRVDALIDAAELPSLAIASIASAPGPEAARVQGLVRIREANRPTSGQAEPGASRAGFHPTRVVPLRLPPIRSWHTD